MYKIIDLHTDLIHSYLEFGDDVLFKEVRRQMTIGSLKKSPVDLFFAAFSGDDEYKNTLFQLSMYKELFTRNRIKLVNDRLDLDLSYKHKKAILHIEGGGYIKNTDDFETLYKQGIRSIGLTYSDKSSLGSGIGLTELGKQIIKLSNKGGVVVDLAHASEKTFKDSISISTRPVIISHTACRSIVNHPRNTSDDQLKLIAKQNGVIGIFFSGAFIVDSRKPDVDDVVKHFEHVANLVGTKHLAIGSDFAGISKGTPRGLEGYLKFKDLVNRLKKAGFSRLEIEDITYRNALRVLNEILL